MDFNNPKPLYKTWAIVGLVALLINVCYHFMVVAQIKYQLVSDFIPRGIIWDIAKSNIIVGLLHFTGLCLGLIFFVKKKYTISTVLCLSIFVLGEIYFFFANY
ncbi:MAG: hypothetical protein EOO87_12730 [Pedobacter sp.]|nr:MAG: hypothetical protein EOO87_12730 [Pedobacter sp.]